MNTPPGPVTPPDSPEAARLRPANMAAAPPPPPNDCPPAMLQSIADGMLFLPSERHTVSCGTVCVDPRGGSPDGGGGRVLILYNRRLGIWQLPKGRKNVGEGLAAAALRETYEETGVRAALVTLGVPTRATPGPGGPTGTLAHGGGNDDLPGADHGALGDDGLPGADHGTLGDDALPGAIKGSLLPGGDPKLYSAPSHEHIGVVQYPDLQAATPGTVKTVFFFAATADASAPMGPGAQEAHEDLEAAWVAFGEADRRLRFAPEKAAMWRVRALMGI